MARDEAENVLSQNFSGNHLSVLIEAYLNLGEYSKADSLYIAHQSKINGFKKEKTWQIETKRNIARLKAIEFNFEEALSLYEEVLASYSEQGNWAGLAQTQVNLAEYYRITDQLELSTEILLKIIDHPDFEQLPMAVRSNAYHRLAAVARSTESDRAAIDYLMKSLSYSEPIDHLDHLSTAYLELGDIYNARNDERAIVFLNRALATWEKMHYHHYMGGTYLALSRYYFNQGQFQESLNAVNQAISISKKYNHPTVQNTALEIKAQILYLRGDFKRAYQLRDTSAQLTAQIISRQYDKDVLEVSRKFKAKLNEAEIDLAQGEKEVAVKLADSERQVKVASLWVVAFLMVASSVIIGLYLRIRKKNRAINKQNRIIEDQLELLNNSVKEKDTLLREVHHRVKNNLQLIISLVEMQLMNNEKHASGKPNFQDLLGRVASMALVHEQLYAQSEMAQIQVKPYLENLIKHLTKLNFSREQGKIQTRLKIDSFSSDISRCIALGMIINELYTNSIKHAFSETSHEARIWLEINEKNSIGQVEMNYRDNGPGLRDTDYNNFGLRLIRLFTKQLDGVIINQEVESKRGYGFNLVFSKVGAEANTDS